MPVGNYFKGGLVPTNWRVQDEYDPPCCTTFWAAKVGGTMQLVCYQGRLPMIVTTPGVIYLDPAHTKIEEVGSANFFGITTNNRCDAIGPLLSCHLLLSTL